MRIQRLDLQNFKAFERFTLHLGSSAFLVGPNNAGKSTLVAATRVTAGMLAYASRRRTTGNRRHDRWRARTHPLARDQFGLVTENLRHQFRPLESTISIQTDSDIVLTAVWPAERDGEEPDPFFYLRHTDDRMITEPGVVRETIGPIGIVPGLYPINHRERVLDEDYVRGNVETRRASQHTRNQLHLIERDGEFADFREFAVERLPEIEDLRVATSRGSDLSETDIDVFLTEREDRTEKELFWAGDGIQVFVQLLAHLWRLRGADVIILDEPDLYLHADLQRRLVRLLEATQAQTITATHSSEMLAEAASESVVWVDKSRRRGIRRPTPAALEDLSTQIGSSFNLRLATALRARTVVFVEGDDMTVIRALAKTLALANLANERNCAVIEIKGFSNWVQVEPFRWFVRDFLDDAVEVFVLLDRDYRSDEQLAEVRTSLESVGVRPHIWHRKELESYLLEPRALSRVSGAPVARIETLLADVTADMSEEVLAQLAARRYDAVRSTGKDLAQTNKETYEELRPLAEQAEFRLHRFPAKRILSRLNEALESEGYAPVATTTLAKRLLPAEIPSEMATWLQEVDASITV